jgi:uncharacterized membrane protein YraQ (UPF0718 family)
MNMLADIILQSWNMLLAAGIYILLGILAAGLLRAFLSPAAVARHLGSGRFSSVAKAALFGIPLPL